MTKEQWLENMSSNNPDYEGLLQQLESTKDKELVTYLVEKLFSLKKDPNPEYIRFVQIVLDDDRTNFMLTEDDLRFVKENEKT